MAKLFFSYSHKDETIRNELEIHLSQLKRQKIIESWHDRLIDAGDDLDKSISQELEDSDIILLLVSPYFLDSGYCYEIELQRALEKHNTGEAKIIPVIVNPCEWLESPLKKLKAVPKDGKPISKYPNQHDAFLEITTAIRKVAEKITPIDTNQNIQVQTSIPSSQSSSPSPLPRSSNLRIKKNFSQQEKDDFLESSFEYMSNYFEGSLNELEKETLK